MKHAILLSTLALTLTLTASAGATEAPKHEEARVLRKVKAVGRIMKFSLKQKGDSLDIKNDEICRFEKELPVFDLKKEGVSFSYVTAVECKSTVNDKPVRVIISAYAAEDLWPNADGTKSEAKIAQASLYVRDTGLGNQGVADLDGYIGTKDMRSSSLLMFLTPAYQPGQDMNREEFSATMELLDR